MPGVSATPPSRLLPNAYHGGFRNHTSFHLALSPQELHTSSAWLSFFSLLIQMQLPVPCPAMSQNAVRRFLGGISGTKFYDALAQGPQKY